MNIMENEGYWTRSKSKHDKTTTFGHLNEDAYRNILIFLPVKDLRTMRLLSKQYNTWTRETLMKRSEVKIYGVPHFLSFMASDISVVNILFEGNIKISDLRNDQKIVKKCLRWMDKHGDAINSLKFEYVTWGTLLKYNDIIDTQYVVKRQDYEFLNTLLTKLTSLKSISIDGLIHLGGNYSNIDSFEIPKLTQITSVKNLSLGLYTYDRSMLPYEADCKEGVVMQKLAHGIATTFPHVKSWMFEYIPCGNEENWTPSCLSSCVIIVHQMLSLMVSSPDMFPALDSLTLFTLSHGCCILRSLEKIKQFSPALKGQIKELKITMGWSRNCWRTYTKIIKSLEEILEYCRTNLHKLTVKLVNENNGDDFPPPTFTLNVPPMPRIKIFRIVYAVYDIERFNLMISDIPSNKVITLSLGGEGGFDII